MNLSELKKGDSGIIVKIYAEKNLKKRLASFGIYKGVQFKVKALSLGGNTIEVRVGNTMIALRRSEAEKIEVQQNE